ncbi:DUF4906 domain-containing protein [uncultured Alistipes sp.]|uniref:DUF4906 domain-containing protein n=1 Tax=uncultured Alistipes sp. TaxID=538949 RepID=UPI0025A4F4D0|nr:DUF4906 domain-containing protein [uncultured Alistipes sp.]
MKILKRLMLVAFVGAMFAACSKDLDSDPVNPAGPNEGPEGPTTTVTFSLAPSDMSAPSAAVQLASAPVAEDSDEAISFGLQPATRATVPASADEKTLVSVCILQFDGETDAAKLTLNKYFTKADITDKNTLSVPLNEYEKTTVYAIANIAKTAADKFTSDMTLADFKKAKIGMSVIDASKLTTTGLPMMGSVTSADFTDAAATVKLSFLVAKIVSTPTVAMQTGLGTFTIKSAELKSVLDSVAVVAPTESTLKSTFDGSYGLQTYSASEPFVWYVPENLRGDVAGLKASQKSWWNAPDYATHIVISGTYTANVGSKKTYDLVYTIFPGANSTVNFDIKRNTVYTINPTIKGINPNDLRVVFGGACVDLSKGETANCYMAANPLGNYMFKATVKGNGATTAASTCSNGTVSQTAPKFPNDKTLSPKSVQVLWETGTATKGAVIRAVKLFDGYVYFTTAGNLESTAPVVEANALIAVYSTPTVGNETNVHWSWHIWSTSYDPKATGGFFSYQTRQIASSNTSYNSVASRTEKVMTRNLGAAWNDNTSKSFGLLYQWGRKDPFVGASSNASGTTTFATSTMGQKWGDASHVKTLTGASEANITSAIANPTTFYLQRNTTQYDWVGDTYANQRDNLWGNPNTTTKTPNTARGSKSIYDPCPPGWRVAPQDTWTRFTTHGYNTSTASEFNVKGSFNYGWNFIYAGPDKTGSEAFYPAAGYRHVTTGALSYVGAYGNYTGYVNPLGNNRRANGFSVRCVQN